jgi:hypothetical protein
MGDSVNKYYLDDNKEEDKEYSQDVINILELFRLLSLEDKAAVKRLIREENIF